MEKVEVYPLWSDEGMEYLKSIGKIDDGGIKAIKELKESFDEVADISKKDKEDIYCSASSVNINGAELTCIKENEENDWNVGDIAYQTFINEEQEKACLESGHWKKTQESRLDNSVLQAMEVTPDKANSLLPSQLHKNSVSKDDMHLLFFEVQVKKDSNDQVQSVGLAPNPRMIDYLENFQVNSIIQAQINKTNKDIHEDLSKTGIFTRNPRDYQNLGYTNNFIRKFKNKGLGILGVSEKYNNAKEQNDTYLKLGTSLANYAFEYTRRQGIIHVLHSDVDKMYNCYGKQEKIQNGKEFNFAKERSTLEHNVMDKSLASRYKRISTDYDNPSIALYTVDSGLVKQIKEQGLMKWFYSFDKRFEKEKEQRRDVIHFKKNLNKKWTVAKGVGIIGPETQKTLNNMQNIEYKYDEKSYAFIQTLCRMGHKDKILKLMGYVDPKSEEYASSSFKKKEGIEGKNAVCEASLDNYLANYSSEPFLLKGKLQRTMRYMLTGRINGDEASINPQSDKFQRFLISPVKQLESSFDEGNPKDVVGMVKCLGFSLGMKVENMTNRELIEGFNKKFKELSGDMRDIVLMKDSPDGNSVDVKLNKKYIGTEEFRKGSFNNVFFKVINGETDIGESGSVFKNFSSLYTLSEEMEKTKDAKTPQKHYDISFLGEIDGTNNGIAFKMAMMPLSTDKEIISKCGLLSKDLYTQMGDFKGRDDGKGGINTDFYQSCSVNFDKVCKEKNPEFLEAFQGLIGEDPLSKNMREVFKKVVTPAGYGGIVSPIRTFNEKILDVYEKKQAKRSYELSKMDLNDAKNTKKIASIAKEGYEDTKCFFTLMGLPTESDDDIDKIIDLNKCCLGVSKGKALGEGYDENKLYFLKYDKDSGFSGVATYDKDVYNILNKDATEDYKYKVKDTEGISQDLILGTLNKTFPDLVPLTKAEVAVGQLHCKLYEDFRKDFNLNINDNNFDKENKTFKNGALNGLNYHEAMLNIAQNTLPFVTCGDTSIPAAKEQASELYDSVNVGQELKVQQNFKGILANTYQRFSRLVTEDALLDSGTAASVLKIHPEDAHAARETVKATGFAITQVYDAFVTNHQQFEKVGDAYNKHWFNAVTTKNPIENALENFDKSVRYIDKISRENNIPLSKELRKTVDDYLLNSDNEALDCVKNLHRYNQRIKENKAILYANPDEYICDQMAGGSLKIESINELKARQERIKKAQEKNKKEEELQVKENEKNAEQAAKTVVSVALKKVKSKKNEID